MLRCPSVHNTLPVCPSADGCVGAFRLGPSRFLWIALQRTRGTDLFAILFSVFWDQYPEMGLLDHIVVLFKFLRNRIFSPE